MSGFCLRCMKNERKDDNEKIIVAASGYFDPLHAGHIEYLKLARELGDKLIVILNNDKQTILKKGKVFMPLEERKSILESLKMVDEVFVSIDEDRPIIESIKKVHKEMGPIHIFAKGGDRFAYEIPEAKICRELGIKIIDGLGEKIQSSSWLIKGEGCKNIVNSDGKVEKENEKA